MTNKLHPKMNAKWTFHETMQVVTQRQAGASFNSIAQGLGRTPAACGAKFFEIKRKQPHLFKVQEAPEAPEPPEVVVTSERPFDPFKAAFVGGLAGGAVGASVTILLALLGGV